MRPWPHGGCFIMVHCPPNIILGLELGQDCDIRSNKEPIHRIHCKNLNSKSLRLPDPRCETLMNCGTWYRIIPYDFRRSVPHAVLFASLIPAPWTLSLAKNSMCSSLSRPSVDWDQMTLCSFVVYSLYLNASGIADFSPLFAHREMLCIQFANRLS